MDATLIFPPDTLPLTTDTMSLPNERPIFNNAPRKTSLSSSKPNKGQHRVTKRTSSGNHRDKMMAHAVGMAGTEEQRKSRVWKACERCRMKKTKCDGQWPCKRCTDDGLICAAGHRRRVEFKQLPRGYAEVLEHSQHALSATIVKLFKMVQAGETWTQGKVQLNDKNEPSVHDIAEKLHAIRAGHDLEVQVTNSMPQNENDLLALQNELWALPNANGQQQRPLSASAGQTPSPVLPVSTSMPNLAGGMPPRNRQNSDSHNNSSADEATTGGFGNNGWSHIQQQRPLHQSSSVVSSPGSLSLGWDSTPSAELDYGFNVLPGHSPISTQSPWDAAFPSPMSRGNSFQGNNVLGQFSPAMPMPGSPNRPSTQQGGPMSFPAGPGRMAPIHSNGGLKGSGAFGESTFNPMISGSFTGLDNDDGNGYNGI